ncbi:MAG: ribonuclease E/G [Actinobacteria bacterium]|nr:MAG: ribonuclease E/G [Actinomycetota bacterium]
MVDKTELITTPAPRRRAASRPAGPPAATIETGAEKPAKKTAKKVTKKSSPEKSSPEKSAVEKPVKKTAKKATKKLAAATEVTPAPISKAPSAAFIAPLFQAADPVPVPRAAVRKRATRKSASADALAEATTPDSSTTESGAAVTGESDDEARRRRRRRGGRGRRRRPEESESGAEASADTFDTQGEAGDEPDDDEDSENSATTRRRRRRRRGSESDVEPSPDDPPNTVVKVRAPRTSAKKDDASSMRGSTRLEAKKMRRREGREAGRRRAPILTEAEFLARRESVDRVMAVRQIGDRTQIAVLEDGVLVEHYVTRGSSSSLVGNVYLGRVQNVLPSMEAAFVDIGRGRNAVLYAGEVNWDAAGLDGQPKRIEFALKSGDTILVQVTKDPVGQKGARLTSQISLPGRYLVYVPDGSMTGISRKLPDTERSRLKNILKRVIPEEAGVIVRTAAEGAPEEALEQDIMRLKAQSEAIAEAVKTASPPTLLHGEPDLAIKVVRDIFNEDVNKLVVSGDTAWEAVTTYINGIAPDLVDRLQHWVSNKDLFDEYRVDEQLAKALDRKVFLPSGGSLVIDRTEAMTVVDVNTGKFIGQGGNLEQTVTSNNLEAAEEIVRQLRLRDVGGIIVIDFIDMVLEINRDLVLRRLVESLGRDRTKHQVAEVTSLGLVQMTRKRIGSGLIESFSTPCDACAGRGLRISMHPVDNGNGDYHSHDHEISPKKRRPANAVDPADVAARTYERADELADAIVPDGETVLEAEFAATQEVLETGLSKEAV